MAFCFQEKELDLKDMNMKPCTNIFNELAFINGLFFWGGRIVVPQGLGEPMVRIAHEGGIVRTQQLLWAQVWFSKLAT